MDNNIDDELINKAQKALIAQAHQRKMMEEQVGKASLVLDDLGQLNDRNLDNLDKLLF